MCSTVWTTQRCSWSYTEKRREGDRSGQEDKRGESKGERQIQPVISSLSVLHSPEHTEIHRVGQRREGVGREIEVTWWKKRRVQRGESKDAPKSNPASNLTPK